MEISVNDKFKAMTPSNGKVITQASVADERERIITHQMCLPLNADETIWKEWTEAQAEAWERRYQPEQEPEEK